MVTFLKCQGTAVVIDKRTFFGTKDTSKTYCKLELAFLGMQLGVMVDDETYDSVNEGDEVLVSGTPDVYQDQFSLKNPEVRKVGVETSAAKAPPAKQGMFSPKAA